MRKLIWVNLVLSLGLLGACSKTETSTSQSSAGSYTSEILLNALRGVALRTTLSLPPAADVDALLSAGDPLTTYNSLVEKYVKSESFRAAMLDYYSTVFGMNDDPNNNNDDDNDDPALLAAGIIMNDSDYCDLVTAKYKIGPNGARIEGQDANGIPLNAQAGFMTLSSWLTFYKGNQFLFNYVREIARVAECYEYPDPDALGAFAETQIATKYESRDGVACFNCHKTLNVRRSVFYKLSITNNANDPPQWRASASKGNDLYGHEPTLYNGAVVDEPRAGGVLGFVRPFNSSSDSELESGSPARLGKQICELPRFSRCAARRFLAFGLGYFGGLAGQGLGKAPFDFDASSQDGDRELLEKWTNEFVSTHNRRVRPFLIAFFESEDYILRVNNGGGQ